MYPGYCHMRSTDAKVLWKLGIFITTTTNSIPTSSLAFFFNQQWVLDIWRFLYSCLLPINWNLPSSNLINVISVYKMLSALLLVGKAGTVSVNGEYCSLCLQENLWTSLCLLFILSQMWFVLWFFGHFFSKDDVNFHSLIESIDNIMAFGNSICFFVRKRIFLFVWLFTLYR